MASSNSSLLSKTLGLILKMTGTYTTAELKQNFEKLDLLGATSDMDSANNTILQSQQDVVLQPNSASAGGAGCGGSVVIGQDDTDVDSVCINAEEIKLNGSVISTGSSCVSGITIYEDVLDIDNSESITLAGPATWNSSYSLILPNTAGSPGQVLTTDGAGSLSWSTSAGGATSSVAKFSDTWSPAEGLTKVINHGLNSMDIMVQLYEIDTGATITINDEIRTSLNQMTLNSSILPVGTGWRIIVIG